MTNLVTNAPCAIYSSFSELTLLLPNTDIELVVFGKAGYNLVRLAKKEYRGSIATNDIVWNYTAPRKSGGGSINIRIHSATEDWTRTVVMSGSKPDAMVGLNAGILSYHSWGDPIIFSTMFVKFLPYCPNNYYAEVYVLHTALIFHLL